MDAGSFVFGGPALNLNSIKVAAQNFTANLGGLFQIPIIIGIAAMAFCVSLACAPVAWGFGFNCKPFVGIAAACAILVAPLVFVQYKKTGGSA